MALPERRRPASRSAYNVRGICVIHCGLPGIKNIPKCTNIVVLPRTHAILLWRRQKTSFISSGRRIAAQPQQASIDVPVIPPHKGWIKHLKYASATTSGPAAPNGDGSLPLLAADERKDANLSFQRSGHQRSFGWLGSIR